MSEELKRVPTRLELLAVISDRSNKIKQLQKEVERLSCLREDAMKYIIDTAEFGVDGETLQSRAEIYREELFKTKKDERDI